MRRALVNLKRHQFVVLQVGVGSRIGLLGLNGESIEIWGSQLELLCSVCSSACTGRE